MSASVNAMGTNVQQLATVAAACEADPARWEACFRRLFQSGLLHIPGVPAGEFALKLPAGSSSTSAVSAPQLFWRRLEALLHNHGCAVGIDLAALSATAMQSWLAPLRAVRARSATGRRWPILLSIDAGHPSAVALLKPQNDSQSGWPPIAVRYSTVADRSAALDWSQLVALSHADARIRPVPLMAVRPLNGLYAAETGEAVMPISLFEARSETAWLVLELSAPGLVDPRLLRQRFTEVLRFADNLLDTLSWSRPGLQIDALLNRRIAIRLTGIGDLLARRGVDPRQPQALVMVRRWLEFVRRCFMHASCALAQLRGPFPELGLNELIASLAPRYGVADARRLARNHSLRHRHLLALSPFVMFPDNADTPVPAHAWLNLIPAISGADTIAMYGRDVRARLSTADWGRLLQLTSAAAANSQVVAQGRAYSGII